MKTPVYCWHGNSIEPPRRRKPQKYKNRGKQQPRPSKSIDYTSKVAYHYSIYDFRHSHQSYIDSFVAG